MAETYYSLTDIVKLCDNLVAALPTSFYSGIMTVRGGLANIPAADVVPVVRCEECKLYGGRPWENGKTGICARTDIGVAHDDFCSYGLRMDGDGE